MSHVVSTSVAAFCHGEDHPRGVPVATIRVAAVVAVEESATQPETVLGSRSALRAGHGGVGGRYQHHLPARPLTGFDKGSFGGSDRGVGCLAGHGGPREKLGLEVLHGDQGM